MLIHVNYKVPFLILIIRKQNLFRDERPDSESEILLQEVNLQDYPLQCDNEGGNQPDNHHYLNSNLLQERTQHHHPWFLNHICNPEIPFGHPLLSSFCLPIFQWFPILLS